MPLGEYPTFEAFPKTKSLSIEAAAQASFEQRVASVWPFIVKQVNHFSKSLKPRESANYDPEDLCNALWVTLREKDAKWRPGEVKYITFASRIIRHELYA